MINPRFEGSVFVEGGCGIGRNSPTKVIFCEGSVFVEGGYCISRNSPTKVIFCEGSVFVGGGYCISRNSPTKVIFCTSVIWQCHAVDDGGRDGAVKTFVFLPNISEFLPGL